MYKPEVVGMKGARCGLGHELEILSEGYGLCMEDAPYMVMLWYPWRFTPPTSGLWDESFLWGRDGKPIVAWVGQPCSTKQEALYFIQSDIDWHRALPFDEERERARLAAI